MKISISCNQQGKRNTIRNSGKNKKLHEKVRIQTRSQLCGVNFFKQKLLVVLSSVIRKYFILELLKHLKIDTHDTYGIDIAIMFLYLWKMKEKINILWFGGGKT